MASVEAGELTRDEAAAALRDLKAALEAEEKASAHAKRLEDKARRDEAAAKENEERRRDAELKVLFF
jgi:hypothetical protein